MNYELDYLQKFSIVELYKMSELERVGMLLRLIDDWIEMDEEINELNK